MEYDFRAFKARDRSLVPRAVKKRSPPVSIRLTDTERAQLLERAGTLGLSTYIKLAVFRSDGTPLRRLPRRAAGDALLLARLLAQLGKLQFAADLGVLARAARDGLLQLNPDTEQQLRAACEQVQTMRGLLVAALSRGNREGEVPRAGHDFAQAAQSVRE